MVPAPLIVRRFAPGPSMASWDVLVFVSSSGPLERLIVCGVAKTVGIEYDHAAGGVLVGIGLGDAVEQVARVLAGTRAGIARQVDGVDRGGARFEGPDVHDSVHDARVAGPALVGGQRVALGSTARALLPASMAGLPASKAMVWVGPPLSASIPRSGLVTPTRLPLVPLVRPPDPVPIRLYALSRDTLPAISFGVAVLPVPFEFCAMIVLLKVAVPAGHRPRPQSRRRRPCCRRWCR